MVNISILVLKNAVLSSVSDARYVFHITNRFLQQAGRPPLFDVKLVSMWDDVAYSDGMFSVKPDTMLKDVIFTDLVIIPALSGDIFSATHINREYGAWIAKQYKQGAEIAGFCVGVFLMAFSGVLKGKRCTTHWMYANEFRSYYPDVILADEKIIVNQNGLHSSGGSNSHWNLLLHMVEKYTDREMAILVAKYFVVDLDKISQSSFAVFSGVKDHEDEIIKDAQAYIEQHYREKITVDELADKFCTTRRTFERKFKKATGITVVEYIQRVKIESAKKQLETGRKTVNDVMFDVGYSDRKAFRDVFKKITGMSPIDYRNKYNKEAIS